MERQMVHSLLYYGLMRTSAGVCPKDRSSTVYPAAVPVVFTASRRPADPQSGP